MLLKINPYRIAINPSILHSSAEDLLASAEKLETLQQYLGWDPAPDILQTGFAPLKEGRQLLTSLKKNEQRLALKSKRLASGYGNFVQQRKGIKGWIQKTFRDSKELNLPAPYQTLAWLRSSPRYLLLVSMHDALISAVSTSEPRRIELKESSLYPNPIALALYQKDIASLTRISEALASPLHKIAPDTLIDCFPGYVLHYDRKNHPPST
ncbi:MAG: hypothetical protein HC904_09535 [Blastochloris sp.]|nr:hypothetical protein [Blastochloris sp.]